MKSPNQALREIGDSVSRLSLSFAISNEQFLETARKVNECIAEYQREIEVYRKMKWYQKLWYSLCWDLDDFRNILRHYWK